MSRLIVVSNRLPFSLARSSARSAREGFVFKPSAGGLVTALGAYLSRARAESGLECVWVGWPGADVPSAARGEIRAAALREHGSWPVFMDAEEADGFYNGFCNKALWPLFHYFTTYAVFDPGQWEDYVAANRRFADELDGLLKPGDRVWVHDYQLMLLPGLLRERHPDLVIGFFLHIPFPDFEVFRLLPTSWRETLLRGVLGADQIGFHTNDYSQYFLRSVYRTLGCDHRFGKIQVGERVCKVDTFPIGIDAARFVQAAESAGVRARAEAMRAEVGAGRRLMFSVDRLDYTKGLLHRLTGFGEFLEHHPEWREQVVLVLSVVPSREDVPQYRRMKKELDEMVGRINGRFGNVGWMPLVYQYRSLSFEELVAFYRAADVGLITPLRDGMNLVAKEYVACRVDDDGVLILGETAGASRDLGEALLVNPNHQAELADAIHAALTMPPDEQQRRMRPMRERVQRDDAAWWADAFLTGLDSLALDPSGNLRTRRLVAAHSQTLANAFAMASKRLILLDYDGTLVPFAPLPHLAKPDAALHALLSSLRADARNVIAVVSGRDRGTLEDWLGGVGVHLVAEHGAWLRAAGGEWRMLGAADTAWKDTIRPLMGMYAARLPGSFLEEKDYSLAWHYRGAESELGATRAKELVDDLVNYTANFDVHVLEGNKVVEIRNAGHNKGAAALELVRLHDPDFVLCAGDDQTDEDMFRALPAAVTVRVGSLFSRARFSVADHHAVRALLDRFAAA